MRFATHMALQITTRRKNSCQGGVGGVRFTRLRTSGLALGQEQHVLVTMSYHVHNNPRFHHYVCMASDGGLKKNGLAVTQNIPDYLIDCELS